MTLIPWKYLTDHLNLPDYSPKKLEENLNYHGLEAKVIEREGKQFLEFDTLPNRSDLLSWWGIIQEIAIILNCQKKITTFYSKENQKKIIEVENKVKTCSDFNLGFVRDIEIKESPSYIKEWLKVNNINPINNIVDIANLIMLESGQPLHIFDYDSLSEKKLTIRNAYQGEKIKSLNNQKLFLDSEDIIISSGNKIIDLAGIIGVQETSINFNTKNILIESASFDSKTIKKTAKRLNLTTAASRFFSRGANLAKSPKQVLDYAISLISETYRKDFNSIGSFSYWEEKKTPVVIEINQEFIVKKTGQLVTEQIIEKIWQQLGFSYQKREKFYCVTIPLSRPDLIIPEDLLEELLRVYDYNQIANALPKDSPAISFHKEKKTEREKKKLKAYLTNQGWQEIITYSLISEEMKQDFEKESKNSFYQLIMTKNEYHKYYRQNLLSSHLKTLNYNLARQNKNLFFFEISSVYGINYGEEFLVFSATGQLLNQPIHKLINKIDFFWLKGILENIFDLLRINDKISFSSTENAHQISEIFLDKDKIGFLGQIESLITKKYQINEPIFMAQISLTKIFNYLSVYPPKFVYRPVSNFPTSEKDLSFIFPQEINYNEVIKEFVENTKESLQEVKVFDVYQNDELLNERKKSVSFRLVFQSLNKTLESNETERIIKEIVEKIEEKFLAKLRG
ncbi:MAG: Phenylalanine--tRNA ligase beta subunit [Mycoplasmataceae bacterium]|nr:MAG: Phenylalanine--tRNA ligase beta subunit [Mycoplasmataceae bacterium]